MTGSPFKSGSTRNRDLVDGISILETKQRSQVLAWLQEYGLSTRELATWRAHRKKFIRTVNYPVKTASPVDLICRDIYEIKFFARRLVKLFNIGKFKLCESSCKQVFVLSDVRRWASIEAQLAKPFKFVNGEPQALLHSLKEPVIEISTDDEEITDSVPRTGKDLPTTSRSESASRLSDDFASFRPLRYTASSSASQGSSISAQPRRVHELPLSPGGPRPTCSQRHLFPRPGGSPELSSSSESSDSSADDSRTDHASTSTESKAAGANRGANKPAKRQCCEQVSEALELYLKKFFVTPCEFVNWLMLTGFQQNLEEQSVALLIDHFLTLIANAIVKLDDPGKVSLADVAYHLKAQPGQLERWIKNREVFFQDKTRLKLDMFQEKFIPRQYERYLGRLQYLFTFPLPRLDKNYEIDSRYMNDLEEQVRLLQKIMEFYELPYSMCEHFPWKFNLHMWTRDHREKNILPMILFDMETCLRDLYEVALMLDTFDNQGMSLCYGKMADYVGEIPILKRPQLNVPLNTVLKEVQTAIPAQPNTATAAASSSRGRDEPVREPGTVGPVDYNRKTVNLATLRCVIWRYEEFKRQGKWVFSTELIP